MALDIPVICSYTFVMYRSLFLCIFLCLLPFPDHNKRYFICIIFLNVWQSHIHLFIYCNLKYTKKKWNTYLKMMKYVCQEAARNVSMEKKRKYNKLLIVAVKIKEIILSLDSWELYRPFTHMWCNQAKWVGKCKY